MYNNAATDNASAASAAMSFHWFFISFKARSPLRADFYMLLLTIVPGDIVPKMAPPLLPRNELLVMMYAASPDPIAIP